MRRIGNLWQNLVSYENLYTAFRKAFKGTKSREAQYFFYNLENELIMLQIKLSTNTYKPAKYRIFKIYDPKERIISVAPFKDRVVHHAVVNVLEPVYERIFIHDSYATRKYKGTHKAIKRAQYFLRLNRWFLKADIKKYFYSVNHNILLEIIKRKIKDNRLLCTIEKIVINGTSNGKGIPIGNLTSQFFANVYLDIFDHFIKDEEGVKYYIRYMDDFVIFSQEKQYLKEMMIKIKDFLSTKLCLLLKANACFINQRLNGLTFLGVRIFPNMVKIKRDNLKRTLSRLNNRELQYKKGLIDEDKYIQSMVSLIGHMSCYNTKYLRRSYFYG